MGGGDNIGHVTERPFDFSDGRRVPPTLIDGTRDLTGTHNGSVYVGPGAHLVLSGTLNGSLSVEPSGEVDVVGIHNGSLSVARSGTVRVFGRSNGSVHVELGGIVHVARGARLAGALHIEGLVVNQGERGGPLSGSGEVRDEPGSSVKQPVVRNGTSYYQW